MLKLVFLHIMNNNPTITSKGVAEVQELQEFRR